ncbi:MAG: Ig-like domain repeat protein [Armatimonadetes bacterium]|nr:Ig-like domain repeat protein [Armatimonadota bacterium]
MKRCLAWRGLVALSALALLLLSLPTLSKAQDRQLRAWGYNTNGELGDGSNSARKKPCRVSEHCGVLQIAGGRYHTASLKTDGTVWTWGANSYGQLGCSSVASSNLPRQVSGITNIVQIANGALHSLALKSDGTVWAWGCNKNGQLGDGTNQSHATPIQVVGLVNVVQIAGGNGHSLALKADGTAWAWGSNTFGQLGDGTTTDKPVPVQAVGLVNVARLSCGNLHSLALKSDGTVWTWGANLLGQLGDGTYDDSNTPVQVYGLESVMQVAGGALHSLALKSDGSVWAWGSDNEGLALPVVGLSEIAQIAGGGGHSIALKSDGTVWTWGRNAYGQLGDGTKKESDTPVQVTELLGATQVVAGHNHSLALVRPPRLDSYANSGYFGSTATLTARIRRRPDGANLTGAMVTFSVEGTSVGTAIADSRGYAKLPYAIEESLSVGTHKLVASYAGDALSLACTAETDLSVLQTPTLLLGSNVSGKVGTTLSLRVRLKRTSDLNGVPSQHIVFKMDGYSIGDVVTDSKGVGTLSYAVPEMPVGCHSLTAEYAVTAQYVGSVCKGTFTIAKSDTRLPTDEVVGSAGSMVDLTATLKRSSDGSYLVGRNVTFKLAGAEVGTATTDANGVARLPYRIPVGAVGSQKIRTVFGGDAYDNSSSGSASLKVN